MAHRDSYSDMDRSLWPSLPLSFCVLDPLWTHQNAATVKEWDPSIFCQGFLFFLRLAASALEFLSLCLIADVIRYRIWELSAMFLQMSKNQADIQTKAEVGDGSLLALPKPGLPNTQLFLSFCLAMVVGQPTWCHWVNLKKSPFLKMIYFCLSGNCHMRAISLLSDALLSSSTIDVTGHLLG